MFRLIQSLLFLVFGIALLVVFWPLFLLLIGVFIWTIWRSGRIIRTNFTPEPPPQSTRVDGSIDAEFTERREPDDVQ
jgi:hypothetical protein